jgi:isocitrate/isopropylmalate dehydrogenase
MKQFDVIVTSNLGDLLSDARRWARSACCASASLGAADAAGGASALEAGAWQRARCRQGHRNPLACVSPSR